MNTIMANSPQQQQQAQQPNAALRQYHQMQRDRMLQQQHKERLLQQQQKQSLVVPVNATAGADQICKKPYLFTKY